jgi:hypothetical protein
VLDELMDILETRNMAANPSDSRRSVDARLVYHSKP